MQAIWCLKFWNTTKSGGGFALISVPYSKFRGLVGGLIPRPLVIYTHDANDYAVHGAVIISTCLAIASVDAAGEAAGQAQLTPVFEMGVIKAIGLPGRCEKRTFSYLKQTKNAGFWLKNLLKISGFTIPEPRDHGRGVRNSFSHPPRPSLCFLTQSFQNPPPPAIATDSSPG